MLELNFPELFKLEISILELFLRGTFIYLGILFLMRILPRRTGGELAMMDLIFILLIAEAATHSLGGYKSVAEGFVVIGTLMFWNNLMNWLSFRVPLIEKILSAPPLQIIKAGKLIRRNMRHEYITEAELMDSLRKEGLEDIAHVQAAYVEGDGTISIIRKKGSK